MAKQLFNAPSPLETQVVSKRFGLEGSETLDVYLANDGFKAFLKAKEMTPEAIIEEVARRCKVTPMQVDEVVGYYSMLHRKPMGKFHVQVCTNISCLLVGGEELYEHAKKKLGVGHKQTTEDGQFSLEEVECMGACSWAPAVEINYDFHHFVTPEKLDQLIDGLRKAQ